ncbi:MAG: energy transducer TonB [Pyrinomonadaceae bacterium]
MFRSARLIVLASLFFLIVFTNATKAQDLLFNYTYQFEPTFLTQPPNIKDFHVDFPEDARKNGVDGTAKVSFVFGKDGKTREAAIVQDLPFGVGDALVRGINKLVFKPAMNGAEPIDIKATIVYVITAVYQEYDNNVTKVKLLAKPTAEYPAAFRADGTKGKVVVAVLFYPDGKVKVSNTESTMPQEFDEAAKKAAETLKFQPAVHKKSKKPVAQWIWVTFEFKP